MLDLGMEKGIVACHKSEARGRFPTARGTPREPGFGDEAFWRSQVNFGPPNPATDEKDRGNEIVTLPAWKRCLEDGPDAAERRPRSGFPTSRGTGDGHLEAHHRPTGKTGETREGNPIGSQRIHSTCSLPDFLFIILESGGKGSLFCNGKRSAEQI